MVLPATSSLTRPCTAAIWTQQTISKRWKRRETLQNKAKISIYNTIRTHLKSQLQHLRHNTPQSRTNSTLSLKISTKTYPKCNPNPTIDTNCNSTKNSEAYSPNSLLMIRSIQSIQTSNWANKMTEFKSTTSLAKVWRDKSKLVLPSERKKVILQWLRYQRKKQLACENSAGSQKQKRLNEQHLCTQKALRDRQTHHSDQCC